MLEPSGSEGEIWTAHRKDPSALFTDKRQVGYGRHVAVSSDGLTALLVARRADGQSGDSIHMAKRSSPAESFGRSQELAELRSIDRPRNLFLSQDGLTMLFNEGDDRTFRLSMVTRQSPQLRWGSPQAVPISSRVTFDGLALCPYLTRDGLTLFFNVQNAAGPRFLIMSRTAIDQPFDKPTGLSLPNVQKLFGWTPRYVEATKELFFCSAKLSPAGNMDIWVIRNFDPLPNAEDRSTIRGGKQSLVRQSETISTKPIVRDLGAFTLTKGGRTWNVTMPEHFTKAEVIFYRGDPSDLTLNAAWAGHLQINGKDVVQFKKGSGLDVFLFHDFTSTADYAEKNDYKKAAPSRYLDVTKYLRSGDNSFYYYHEQRADLPMGVILRISEDDQAAGTKVNGGYTTGIVSTLGSPVGKWVELRPGTPVGDRVRTFLADGTLISQTPKDQSTMVGTWRKEGERFYLKASSGEQEERWFTISHQDEKTMTILMMGARKYVWYKSS